MKHTYLDSRGERWREDPSLPLGGLGSEHGSAHSDMKSLEMMRLWDDPKIRPPRYAECQRAPGHAGYEHEDSLGIKAGESD